MKGIVTTVGGVVIACLLALPALAGQHPNDRAGTLGVGSIPALAGQHPNDRAGALGVGSVAASPAAAVGTQARPDGRELPDGADLGQAPATILESSNTFDWGDAGIGLAGGIGLGLLLVAGLVTTQHIRRVSGAS